MLVFEALFEINKTCSMFSVRSAQNHKRRVNVCTNECFIRATICGVVQLPLSLHEIALRW